MRKEGEAEGQMAEREREREGLLPPLLLMIKIRCHMGTCSHPVPALHQRHCQASVSGDSQPSPLKMYGLKREQSTNNSILPVLSFGTRIWCVDVFVCMQKFSQNSWPVCSMCVPPSLAFFVHGFWGSNSDHHTCMTTRTTRITETCPEPLRCPFVSSFSLTVSFDLLSVK